MIPQGFPGPLPLLLRRTPYEAPADDARLVDPALQEADWVKGGYISVVQDIRGRFRSEGQFVMNRPSRDLADPKSIDETTDAYDTIDWLVKNVPNTNGKAGMIGTSYDGWLVIMALLDPHPALAVTIPQAVPADLFLGDDFFHHGALRRLPAFEYVALMEGGVAKEMMPFTYDRGDDFDWHLATPLASFESKVFHGERPTWSAFARHPSYDVYWKDRNVLARFKKPKVPTLHVGGWFDVEDLYGTFANYQALERLDADHKSQLIIGPWRHGRWDAPGSQPRLLALDFEAEPTERFHELRARWLAHYQRGEGEAEPTEAWVFETGSNQGRAFDRFPPADAAPRRLSLHAGGRVSFAPRTDEGVDEYLSDPRKPVPHAARPVGAFWPVKGGDLDPSYGLWRIADQRFASARPDVASWVSEPLDADLTVAGEVVARSFASTTAMDCDFVVKLLDVYPEGTGELSGYELMILDDVLPARFREGFPAPRPVKPGKVAEYDVELHARDHRFSKGHRTWSRCSRAGSAHRAQPPVDRRRLQGHRRGSPQGDAAHRPLAALSIAHRAPRARRRRGCAPLGRPCGLHVSPGRSGRRREAGGRARCDGLQLAAKRW